VELACVCRSLFSVQNSLLTHISLGWALRLSPAPSPAFVGIVGVGCLFSLLLCVCVCVCVMRIWILECMKTVVDLVFRNGKYLFLKCSTVVRV